MADFEGINLQPNDEIGIYDHNLCVGAARVTGDWPLTITAWREDPEHTLPGFVDGNRIQFRVWQQETGENPATPEFSMGSGFFGNGLGSILSNLHGWQAAEQRIFLDGNRWELISFNLRPAWVHAENVFGSVGPLETVWNDRGGLWQSGGNYSTIVFADPREGYRVYSNAAATLTLPGSPLPANLIHSLETGHWNYLAYTLAEPQDPAVALADIVNQVVVVMNDDGEFWWPGVMQTLPEMVPGDGYRIWVNEDVNFIYNSITSQQTGDEVAATPRTTLPAVSSAPPSSGHGWLARVQVDENLLDLGAETVNLMADGTVVGSGLIDENGIATVICWEGDRELGIPGFAAGAEMTVQVRDRHNTTLACDVAGSALRFGERPITSLTVTASLTLPTRFDVSAVTPNPFNPSFTMTLELPSRGDVRIRVVDVLGRQVAMEILRGRAGQTKWTFDAGQHNLASGLYLVQVRCGTETLTRKAMLLK
ncbi:T9SS type A sorting domain-containing protein [bacterium]|nr:T9SS type A sorting domain-containing protein [bacterium]